MGERIKHRAYSVTVYSFGLGICLFMLAQTPEGGCVRVVNAPGSGQGDSLNSPTQAESPSAVNKTAEPNNGNESSAAPAANGALVGTYAIKERGTLKEFIKIEQQGDQYFLSEKQSGRWLRPVPVAPRSSSDLAKVIKEPVTVPVEGLGNNQIAIYKVPVGWRTGKFVCNTGYWLASMLGPIELHRM